MKLRWRIVTKKTWQDWVHTNGMQDGGYVYEDTGRRVLQIQEGDSWVDVLDEEGNEVIL